MRNLSRFFHFHEGEPWQRAVKVSGAFLGMLALAFVSVSLGTITSAQETPRARAFSHAETIQRYPAALPLLTYQASDADYDGISENDACPNTPWELIAFRTRTRFVSPITGATTGLVLSRIVDRIRTIDVVVGNARASIPLNGTKVIAGYQVAFMQYLAPVNILLIRSAVDAQGCTVPPSAEAASTPPSPSATDGSASGGNAPVNTAPPPTTPPPSPGQPAMGREFPLRSGDFTITPPQGDLTVLSRSGTNTVLTLGKFNLAFALPVGSRDVAVIDEIEVSMGFEGASLTDAARNALLDLFFPTVSNGTPVECGADTHWSNRYRLYDQDGIQTYGGGGGACDRSMGRITFRDQQGGAFGLFSLSDSARRKFVEFRTVIPSLSDAQFAPLSRITPSITRVVYHLGTNTAVKYEFSLIPVISVGRRVRQ